MVGPEDLSPNDMAQIMSEVLQRPVRFQQVTGADYKATLMQYGITEAGTGPGRHGGAKNDGVDDVEPRTPPSTTSFRQWCQEELRPTVLAEVPPRRGTSR